MPNDSADIQSLTRMSDSKEKFRNSHTNSDVVAAEC